MKTRLRLALPLLIVPLALAAVTSGPKTDAVPTQEQEQDKADEPGQPVVHQVTGKGKLPDSFSKAIKRPLSKRLEATTKLHITDWFGAKAVSGQVDVKNPTKEEIFTSYHLAVFDKKGELLGCASQNLSFDPGEETIIGGAVIQMPATQIKQIASYKIVWYEDTVEIGKR